MNQKQERVSSFQFTRSWRNRADFPTYEDSEDQVRADLQCLFDELRDFLNARLLPAVNTISAAEVTAEGADSVQAALSALRADLAGAVLGQLPDYSLTGRKLAPGALLQDVTAQLTVSETASGGCPAYQNLRFYHAPALGAVFVRGTVAFTRAEGGTFLARYRVSCPAAVLPASGNAPLACAAGGAGSPRVCVSASGVSAQIEIAVENVPAGVSDVSVDVSGWYLCGEVTA